MLFSDLWFIKMKHSEEASPWKQADDVRSEERRALRIFQGFYLQ